jgi:hypothetical protein
MSTPAWPCTELTGKPGSLPYSTVQTGTISLATSPQPLPSVRATFGVKPGANF